MQRRLLILLAFVLTFSQTNVFAQSLDEAKKLLGNEQYGQAVKMLNSLIQTDKKNPEFYYWKGVALFASEDFDRAKTTFAEGIKARGKYPYNHVGMARSFYKEENAELADASILKALQYNKGKDIDVQFAAAEAYLEAKKVKDAEVLLYQAQEDAPDNPKSYIALGNLYLAKKTGKLAENQFREAIEKDPGYVPGYTNLGQLLIDREEYDEGAKLLQKAIELEPNYAPSYKYMGELWFRARKYNEARDNYQKYVELTQNDLRARLRYADFLFLSDNYQEAIKELEKAKIDTTTSVMLRLLGLAYHKLGDNQKAQENLDLYFARIDPKYTIFQDYEAYGRILLEAGDQTKADEYFAKAVEKDYERVTLYEDLAKEFSAEAKTARQARDTATYVPLYAQEVHYRKLFMESKAQVALSDYYRIGLAQYYGLEFKGALESFNEVTKLKDDYLQGHMMAFRAAGKEDTRIQTEDTTAVSWLAKDPAQRIVDLLGTKNPSELKNSEKSGLLAAYTILAFYKFNPNRDDEYNCDAAEFFLEEIEKVSPGYSQVAPIKEYCDAMKAQGAGNN